MGCNKLKSSNNTKDLYIWNIIFRTMSLRKLLTGQPGNIQEFATMSKSTTIPIEILINTWSEDTQVGLEILKNKIIYVCGTFEHIIARHEIRYQDEVDRLDFEYKYYNLEQYTQEVRKLIKLKLDYLSSQGLKYNLKCLKNY